MILNRIKSFICWHFDISKLEYIHRLLNKDSIFTFTCDNKKIQFYLPCKHDYIQTEILICRHFYESAELEKIKDYIVPGMVVVDVGANIGNHTVYFGSILQASRVYSFEPQPIPAEICKKNIMLNDLENIVKLYDFGLGSDSTQADIIYDGSGVHNLGGTMLKESEHGNIIIKKLDDISIPEKTDFVKIDVEGMEAEVLLGAKNTLVKDTPIIWIEIMDRNYETVVSILNGYGYVIKEVLSRNNYVFIHLGCGLDV